MPQLAFPHVVGISSHETTSNITALLNSTTTYCGIAFFTDQTKTLSKVKVYESAVSSNGLGANDLICDLQSDSSGTPNTSIESRNTVTTTPTSNGAVVEFTGFTTSLTKSTLYWLVLKNNNGSGVTITYRFGSTDSVAVGPASSSVTWGHYIKTYNGSTWSAGNRAITGFRLEYNDGSFDGFFNTNVTGGASLGTALRVYGKRETGVLFTTPSNVRYNVIGAMMNVAKIGTPSGNARFRVYSGSTLLGTSNTIDKNNISTIGFFAYFDSVITLEAGTQYRLVISDSDQTGASSSNAYGMSYFTIENDSNTRALVNMSAQQTNTTDSSANPIVWTEDNTIVPPFTLALDKTTPYASQGGGGLAANVLRGFAA